MNDDRKGGLARMVPMTPERAAEAAEHARRCARIIRDWLPVEGREPGASAETMDDWHDKAGWAVIAFAKYHPTPGRYYTIGPEDFGGCWRQMADGMVAVRDHYGWQAVDGDARRPCSDVRGGQELPPIDPRLLDRIERAAAWFVAPEASRQIPPEKQTKPMTKKKAARLLGRTGDESRAVEWLNACIADGIIRWECRSRQSGIYHRDDFPAESQDAIRP